MTALQKLIEAAKEDANLRNPDALNGYGDTILELCALLEKAEEALEEANALNQNWSSDADPEMLAYYSEYRAVVKQGNEALAAIKQWKEQT